MEQWVATSESPDYYRNNKLSTQSNSSFMNAASKSIQECTEYSALRLSEHQYHAGRLKNEGYSQTIGKMGTEYALC